MPQFLFEELSDYSTPFTFELKNIHFNKNKEIDMKTNLNNIKHKQITI